MEEMIGWAAYAESEQAQKTNALRGKRR